MITTHLKQDPNTGKDMVDWWYYSTKQDTVDHPAIPGKTAHFAPGEIPSDFYRYSIDFYVEEGKLRQAFKLT